MLGGLIGAVAASVLPNGRTEAVEAGPQSTAEPAIRQAPRLNQRTVTLNQAPVKVNQAPIKLNQVSPVVTHGTVQSSQAQGSQDHHGPVFNQRRWNINQQNTHWNQSQHQFNQQRLHLNEQRPHLNQRQVHLNQRRHQFNQTHSTNINQWWRPGMNQRRGPAFNHTRPR